MSRMGAKPAAADQAEEIIGWCGLTCAVAGV